MNNQQLGYNPTQENSIIGMTSPNLGDNQLIQPNYFNELADLPSVDIFQDTGCLDCLFPLCIPNKYRCHTPGGAQKLYEFHEDSGCCERCCLYNCRGFTMNINNFVSPKNNVSVLMEGKKPCSLICYCGCGCGKPSLSVSLKSPQGMMLGKAQLNFDSCLCAICDNRIDIIDKAGQLRYCIKKKCFCIGCFAGCCAKCCDILFHIYQDNSEVGYVTKLGCDGIRLFFTKADNFTINFPSQASPEEKMLIIIGVILLDYFSFYL